MSTKAMAEVILFRDRVGVPTLITSPVLPFPPFRYKMFRKDYAPVIQIATTSTALVVRKVSHRSEEPHQFTFFHNTPILWFRSARRTLRIETAHHARANFASARRLAAASAYAAATAGGSRWVVLAISIAPC